MGSNKLYKPDPMDSRFKINPNRGAALVPTDDGPQWIELPNDPIDMSLPLPKTLFGIPVVVTEKPERI